MPRERPRILVVDDDPVTCELLCEVFEREGFAARSEQSGEAALASLKGDGPDVILSDIRMKTRVDGLALLDRVRRELSSLPPGGGGGGGEDPEGRELPPRLAGRPPAMLEIYKLVARVSDSSS